MGGKVFDLRFPLGYLFVALGALLVIKGFADDPKAYVPSLGINLNLIWGGIMVVFGVLCLLLAARRQRQPPSNRGDE
jgi:hypothetical protein